MVVITKREIEAQRLTGSTNCWQRSPTSNLDQAQRDPQFAARDSTVGVRELCFPGRNAAALAH